MEYCRLCAKSEKKHFIPILADTPLRIGEKLEKLFNLKVKRRFQNKQNQNTKIKPIKLQTFSDIWDLQPAKINMHRLLQLRKLIREVPTNCTRVSNCT